MESTPSALDDPAVLNADDAVGHLGDLLVVGDHHNRLTVLLAGHLEQTQHVLAGFGVEVSGRLVGKDDGRLGSERTRDGDPLLLTAGEVVGQIF